MGQVQGLSWKSQSEKIAQSDKCERIYNMYSIYIYICIKHMCVYVYIYIFMYTYIYIHT